MRYLKSIWYFGCTVSEGYLAEMYLTDYGVFKLCCGFAVDCVFINSNFMCLNSNHTTIHIRVECIITLCFNCKFVSGHTLLRIFPNLCIGVVIIKSDTAEEITCNFNSYGFTCFHCNSKEILSGIILFIGNTCPACFFVIRALAPGIRNCCSIFVCDFWCIFLNGIPLIRSIRIIKESYIRLCFCGLMRNCINNTSANCTYSTFF